MVDIFKKDFADWGQRDWERIFKGQTDPDVIAQNKAIEDRKRRQEQKRKDTGL